MRRARRRKPVPPGCPALWHAGDVSDSAPDTASDLEALVPHWLTVPDLAERLGLRLSDARTLLEDRELLAVRIGERRVLAVPVGFVDDDGPLPALRLRASSAAPRGDAANGRKPVAPRRARPATRSSR